MGATRHRLKACWARLRRLPGALARARDGGVAMIFALSLPFLTLIAVAGVDIHRISTVRMNLQDALDAATLAAARSRYLDDANLTRVGLASLNANLQSYSQISLRTDLTTFHLTPGGAVVADAKVDVETLVASVLLPPYGRVMDQTMQVAATSEVLRSSMDVEVALVLDVTGSMRGTKLTSLKSAANDLIDIVVQEAQTPYYSRVALVPYSMGVNLGSRATAARGSILPPASITGAVWQDGTISRSITSISQANTAVVRSNGHGYRNGDQVWISGVRGMTQVNNSAYTVTRIDDNNFSLNGVNSRNYSAYSSGGTIRKCLVAGCEVVVTANNHGLANGERAVITGVRGMTQINNTATNNLSWVVSGRTNNTYVLQGSAGPNYGSYTNSGASYCANRGCEYFTFINANNSRVVRQISTCVSERTGTQAYTAVSPSGSPVGRNYSSPNGDNGCLGDELTPLTSNRDTLKGLINNYSAVGSTAGQIGIAWGWYAVSPTFASLWSGEGRPGAFRRDLLKVVVIMTDGEFNTPYCQDVIAANAGDGSGSASDHINCNATNGSPFAQAEALCRAMKNQGVIVYTVGFDMPKTRDTTPNIVDTAKEVMESCATTADHMYLPESGGDLREAFAAIGREITKLRIAR